MRIVKIVITAFKDGEATVLRAVVENKASRRVFSHETSTYLPTALSLFMDGVKAETVRALHADNNNNNNNTPQA